MNIDKIIDSLRVKPGRRVRLAEHDPAWKGAPDMRVLSDDQLKDRAKQFLQKNADELREAQEVLWANDTWAVLVILQAMDAAGKDGVIKHVMSGVNPQGCSVHAFKRPSDEELDHTFLWRCMKATPERGRIAIFNRSHYEDILIVRVHPELVAASRLPPEKRGRSFWQRRFEDINTFEHHLDRNGVVVLKFFLHMSKEEQKRRLIERLDDPAKHWKFSIGDVEERARWDDYMDAYEQALTHTSTRWAPWHIIPADRKWITRALVSAILTRRIEGLNLRCPEVTPVQRRALTEARRKLLAE